MENGTGEVEQKFLSIRCFCSHLFSVDLNQDNEKYVFCRGEKVTCNNKCENMKQTKDIYCRVHLQKCNIKYSIGHLKMLFEEVKGKKGMNKKGEYDKIYFIDLEMEKYKKENPEQWQAMIRLAKSGKVEYKPKEIPEEPVSEEMKNKFLYPEPNYTEQDYIHYKENEKGEKNGL